MTAAEQLPRFTFEEYLRLDDATDGRHEWVGCQVYAMAGGTDRHLAVMQALFVRLAPLARRRGCRTWLADRRLRTADAAYYPDVFVVCGPRVDRHYESDATLIVEVLSPSTTGTDMREKAAAYAALPGIESYVLVDPDTGSVRLGLLDPEAQWSWVRYPANSVLAVLNGEIDLADVWREVDEVAPD